MFKQIHATYRKVADRPFASALAILLFVGAITTFVGVGLSPDILEELVPRWVTYTLAASYGFGGFCLFLGMILSKGNWEAAGCILVCSGLAVRAIALIATIGFTWGVLATVLFYFMFGWACVERFRQILNGDQIIRIHKKIEIHFGDNGDS